MMLTPPARFGAALLAATLCWCTTASVQAQTPAASAKPPAKAAAKPAVKTEPAAADKTLSLGGPAGAAGPAEAASAPRRGLLTRDELRACFSDEANIRARLAKLEADRAPLETEKQAIATEQAAFREERIALDARQRTATEGLNAKFKTFVAKVEASNNRVLAANEARRTGSAAEREREALNAERSALEKEREGLEAEKVTTVAQLQEVVNAYNAKAVTVDKRVQDWNQRNAKLNDASGAAEAERKDWVVNCSNRRYREEDELAIKAGK